MNQVESEDNEYKKLEKIEEITAEIALFKYNKYITDDNPSPYTGFTALEQIIMFELEDYMDETYDLRYVKALVTIGEAEVEGEDDEEDDIAPPLEYKKLNIKDIDVVEKIKDIAHYNFASAPHLRITDDNPSEKTGETSLEQLVWFHFRDNTLTNSDVEEIIFQIRNRIEILNSGCSLSRQYKDDNFLNDFVSFKF